MSRVDRYQQCARCVMDTTDPDIVFDGRGYCNHCEALLPRPGARPAPRSRRAKLTSVVARMRRAGRGRAYDCILGVSGGIDSCYAAILLKRLGLRTLLVHVDNGWDGTAAVLNIRNTIDRLGFDYESVVLDWEVFRDLQLSFLRASVVEAETPTDIAIAGALHRVAARHRVRYIVSAGNRTTEGILPRSWHYDAKDTTYFRAVHRRFGTGSVRHFPLLGFAREAYYKVVKGINMVYILDHCPYSEDTVRALLRDELGWTPYGGKHHESRYTAFVQSYLLPLKFNIDYRKATLSSLICAGQVGRDEAVRILKSPPYDATGIDRDLSYVAKKLGITCADLTAIVESPARSYRDYPNSERLLTVLYWLYRKLFTGLDALLNRLPRGGEPGD